MVRERIEQLHVNRLVVTRYVTGIERATYGDALAQSARLAGALSELGLRRGDRVATLACNSRYHLELYLAVPYMGTVLHTVNARLPGEAIARLFGHARDTVLFVDRSLLPALAGAACCPCDRS